MAICAIPTCPVIPVGSQKYCMPHKDARTAKELRIAKDPTTLRGGENCISCKRKFIETDFVLVKTAATLRRRKKKFWLAARPVRAADGAFIQEENPRERETVVR